MPMVETSVAVAIPPITAPSTRNGSSSAGTAMKNFRRIAAAAGRAAPRSRSWPDRTKTMAAMEKAATAAGSSPPVNSAAMDTPVTDPMMITTRLGGIVSPIAPEADSIPTNSPGCQPRRFISGKSTGATAAMSAALAPEIPDTKYMATSRTYPSPPRMWPISAAMKSMSAWVIPAISMSNPSSTNSGTASRTSVDIPSVILPTTT